MLGSGSVELCLFTVISDMRSLPGKESDFGQRSLCRCIQGEELVRNDPGSPETSGEERRLLSGHKNECVLMFLFACVTPQNIWSEYDLHIVEILVCVCALEADICSVCSHSGGGECHSSGHRSAASA